MIDPSRGPVRWLRASYIAGAIADGLVGVLMLMPSRMGEAEFRYPMGLGAALMFGWSGLLLWANRKPVDRKGVLLLTIFPVITGLVATGVWAAVTGLLPVTRVLPSSILGISLIALLGHSYRLAIRAERQEGAGIQ